MFGAVKLNGNADFEKYNYSGYGIGFNARRSFSLPYSSRLGKNVTIFGPDMISSMHIDNKKRYLDYLQRPSKLLL